MAARHSAAFGTLPFPWCPDTLRQPGILRQPCTWRHGASAALIWCRQRAARFRGAADCPPSGTVPGNSPARYCPAEWCRRLGAAYRRHGMWCRLLAARCLAAGFGGGNGRAIARHGVGGGGGVAKPCRALRGRLGASCSGLPIGRLGGIRPGYCPAGTFTGNESGQGPRGRTWETKHHSEFFGK